MKTRIGELIFHYRVKNGITQQQFADKVNVSRSYIARLERGDYADEVIKNGIYNKILIVLNN